MDKLSPSSAFFVDSWDSSIFCDNCLPFSDQPYWLDSLDAFEIYYSGSVKNQETFDKLHAEAVQKLSIYSNCKVIKSSTHDAFSLFQQKQILFDFIYADANHQYEWILRDLMEYSLLLKDDGFIQLNDCILSENGVLQNLGVLRALQEFMGRNKEYRVVAQTTGDFADVLIAKKKSIAWSQFYEISSRTNLIFTELPDHLVFNSSFVIGRMSYCS